MPGQKDGSFDAADYIEFYGQHNRGENSYFSPYSVSNVYWLDWGGAAGLRMAETDAGLYQADPNRFVAPDCFRFTRHVEEDNIFDRLLLVTNESRDHWFWQTMNALRSYEFKFHLQHPVSDQLASVKVMMHGSTHPASNPDHHTILKINNYTIEDAFWDGQVEHLIVTELPNSVLKDGENVLTVDMPGDTRAGEVDQVFFNWLELSYWRTFQAKDDFIEIQCEPTNVLHQFTVTGFTRQDINLMDNLGRRLVNFDVIQGDNSYSVIFQDTPRALPTTYYVFTPDAIKKPEQIVAEIPSDLKSSHHGADYIVITHDLFRAAIQPLAEHRATKGLRVAVVDVQDVYDEFNDGIFDPHAIHKFLKHAYENWIPPAPLYVLLVGDATWAYDKQIARRWGKTCFMPTFMKYTYSWGLTSSDNAFVCVSGNDRLPDMFIGRLPVNTPDEAETIVAKIIQYEQQPVISDWRNRICLACGDGAFFEQSADHLYNEYIPASFDVPRLYTNPKSKYFGSTQELVGLFNNGVSLLNFIGHGGGGVFFDAELFLLEDIARLNNPRMLPVIFSLTCFIGYFDNPWTPSLGEELLRSRDKGCIATFGSAGRAWLYGGYYLNNALFKSLFQDNQRHIGQVTTQAKWQMIAWSGSYWDHVENYNLLGDPALKIAFPEKEISLIPAPASLLAGDELVVSGDIADHPSGQVKISLFDVNDSLIVEKSSAVASSRFEARLQVPVAIKPGQGLVKAYFWNENNDATGTAPVGIESPCFGPVVTVPAEPGHQDSTFIMAKVEIAAALAPAGIDSVVCLWSFTQNTWYRIPMSLQPDDLYKTRTPFAVSEGSKVYYKLLAYFQTGATMTTTSLPGRVYSFTARRRADLCVSQSGLRISGKEQVVVQATISNAGETSASNFSVELFDGSPGISAVRIGEKLKINRLPAKADTTLNFAWQGQPEGRHSLYLVIDADNQVPEFNENNNSFQTEIRLITWQSGSAGARASQDSSFALTIPPSAITSNSSFDIVISTTKEITADYPIPRGFTLAGQSDSPKRCYRLQLDNKDAKIIKPFWVSFPFPAQSLDNASKIYAWDHRIGQWSYRATHLDSSQSQFYAEARADDALFGLFTVTDFIPPQISLKIENQIFAEGDFVSSQPVIAAVLEDESGIDITTHPPVITLNNQPIDPMNLKISESPNAKNMVLLTYSPTLPPGVHELKIKAADIAGNWNQEILYLNVSDAFELKAIANHPNPFVDETIIAYTLTGEAQEVKIKIYTTSGRLIRTFDFMNEVGYIEHAWDGRDEMGEEVANGVYYMRFVAVNGKKRIERVEKLAKLK